VDERRSFLRDDDDDTLLFKKLQEHVLEKYPNPARKGCIDHTTLETWVYDPQKLDLSDPKYLHVLKCAECTRELIELRRVRDEQSARASSPAVVRETSKSRDWRWAGLAAVLLCCFALAGVSFWWIHARTQSAQTVSAAPVTETIDLSEAGTTRGGETAAVPPVALPRRVVNAHVLLPYFSPGGNYIVSVTMGRDGSPAKAEGRATASVHGFHADLNVTLDLRDLPEGTYYLATTHEGDQASYYYPLSVN
jgi:hypothetical protein